MSVTHELESNFQALGQFRPENVSDLLQWFAGQGNVYETAATSYKQVGDTLTSDLAIHPSVGESLKDIAIRFANLNDEIDAARQNFQTHHADDLAKIEAGKDFFDVSKNRD